MSDPCGAQHPDHPEVSCGVREALADHEEHIGYLSGTGTIDWPNPDYRPKVHVPPAGRPTAAQVAAVAAAVVRADAAALSDPAANTVGAMQSQSRATSEVAAYAVMPKTGTQRMAVLDPQPNEDE